MAVSLNETPSVAHGPKNIARIALEQAQTAALIEDPCATGIILATALGAIRDGRPWPIPRVFGGMEKRS